MRTVQTLWQDETGWSPLDDADVAAQAQCVFVFGSLPQSKVEPALASLRRLFPAALFLGCSTAGEIHGTRVLDNSLVATAMHCRATRVQIVAARLAEHGDSRSCGRRLAEQLTSNGLVHAFVLSDGLRVNGSELVEGLAAGLPEGVRFTGGLAGDGDRFQRTWILTDRGLESEAIVAAGFYGQRLRVGFGSLGGWDPFGPERLITASKGNVLFELEGKSALGLYKEYLGKHAAALPASGLLFPLSLRQRGAETSVVRTILAVNEEEQSLTFAGNIPQGNYAQFMKANIDRLCDGALGAARICQQTGVQHPELAVCISCYGRRMILKQMAEEEVEGVRDVLGPETTLAGFYSYGEIAPFSSVGKSELHNQTMTITTFSEC